jgi:RHS repeat-associated protein
MQHRIIIVVTYDRPYRQGMPCLIWGLNHHLHLPHPNNTKTPQNTAEINLEQEKKKLTKHPSCTYEPPYAYPQMHYYGYRYYNPKLGRWLNRDPFEEYLGVAMYSIAENNVVDYIDLLGLKKCHSTSWSIFPEINGNSSLFGLKAEWEIGFSGNKKICNKCCDNGETGTETTYSFNIVVGASAEGKIWPRVPIRRLPPGFDIGVYAGLAFDLRSSLSVTRDTCSECSALDSNPVGGSGSISGFIEGRIRMPGFRFAVGGSVGGSADLYYHLHCHTWSVSMQACGFIEGHVVMRSWWIRKRWEWSIEGCAPEVDILSGAW